MRVRLLVSAVAMLAALVTISTATATIRGMHPTATPTA
jgi:hypothetical protein